MAKEKLRLTIEQESDGTVLLSSDEAKELSDILKDAAKQASTLTNQKHQGRVSVESDADRVTVSVSRAKIEKEADDGS